MKQITTLALPVEHECESVLRSRRGALKAAGGMLAGAVALAAGGIAVAAAAVPDTSSDTAFAAAAGRFIALEASRWTRRAANDDYLTDHWSAIDAEQAPLLDLLCNTPASGRPEMQAARARCIGAAEIEIKSGQISTAGARMLSAIVRDAGEAAT